MANHSDGVRIKYCRYAGKHDAEVITNLVKNKLKTYLNIKEKRKLIYGLEKYFDGVYSNEDIIDSLFRLNNLQVILPFDHRRFKEETIILKVSPKVHMI